MARRFGALAVGGMLVLALGAGACKRDDKTAVILPPVRVAPAATAPGPTGLRYSATVQPVTQLNLSFKVGGYVADILQVPGPGGVKRVLDQGDRVPAGTTVARVQTRDYQVQVDNAQAQVNEATAGRVQSEAQLKAAQEGLPQAEAQLSSAQASLDKAQRDWTRAQALYPTQSMTRPDYDTAQMNFNTATANVAAARAGVATANAQIANAQAQLSQSQAKIDSSKQQLVSQQIPLGDTSLKAPTDVVVLSRKIEVGSFVQPATVGFVVATTNPVKVVFSVPDSVVRTLSPGQTIEVSSNDAGPDARWRGPITAISPAADQSTRVFQVEVTLPNPRGDLRLGMIVTVPIGEGKAPEALPAVPLTAIVRPEAGATGYAVLVIADQGGKAIARRREVTLGDVVGNLIIVRDGIRIGEPVIVSGATIAVDGQPVKVVP